MTGGSRCQENHVFMGWCNIRVGKKSYCIGICQCWKAYSTTGVFVTSAKAERFCVSEWRYSVYSCIHQCEEKKEDILFSIERYAFSFDLSHWGRMHICVTKLTIIGSDNGLRAWSAPSHYLNKCWNIVNSNLRNNLQWTLNRNSYISIQENVFENIVCKMAAILSGPQCINPLTLKCRRLLGFTDERPDPHFTEFMPASVIAMWNGDYHGYVKNASMGNNGEYHDYVKYLGCCVKWEIPWLFEEQNIT